MTTINPGVESELNVNLKYVEKLYTTLIDLDSKTGELAEVRKAELQAHADNFRGENVTQARENARHAATQYTQEAIDLQCDIDSLLRWREYYTLLIQRGA